MAISDPVIDDLSEPEPRARNGAAWELIADTVMGGRSEGRAERMTLGGRTAIRMTGRVRLENNGGFLQIALNLAADGTPVDAGGWDGIAIDVLGDDETYGLHLRTADVRRPWQSYRHSFTAPSHAWTTHALPFDAFTPHRIDAPLDRTRLKRIGIVAIGRAFAPDVAVGGIRFYRGRD